MTRLLIPMAIGLFALCGCEARNLYVAHETTVGLNGRFSQNRQSGKLVLGYDREFVTLVPKGTDPTPDDDVDDRDVMASLGCSYLQTNGVALTRYSDLVITGKAATDLAAKIKDGNENLLDCNQFAGQPSNGTSGGNGE